MKLYFKCEEKGQVFGSDDYTLHKGYTVIDNADGGRELQGIVTLNSACPLCGKKHRYEAKDVICPLSGVENGK